MDYTEQHIDKIGYRQPNAPDAKMNMADVEFDYMWPMPEHMYGVQLLEREDCTLPAILAYRSSAGPVRTSSDTPPPIVPTDPRTKPITISPPRNRKEALLSPWWKGYYEAELSEMKSHEKNGTWQLVERSSVPEGYPILRDRWVYDDKLAAGGEENERFKARLTAMGTVKKKGGITTKHMPQLCRQGPSASFCKCIMMHLIIQWSTGTCPQHSSMRH